MADTRWKGVGRKWTLKKALDVSPLAILKMDTRSRAELAQFLYTQYRARERTFIKSGVTGYAMVKLKEDMTALNNKLGMDMTLDSPIVTNKGRMRVLSPTYADRKNPQNALMTYITLLQDFFTAKSSTVKGWKQIGEDQDRRLFGERVVSVSAGRKYKNRTVLKYKTEIAHRMSDAERVMFWKVYREAYKADWVNIHSYSSNDQREFATLWMNGTFNHMDIEEAFNAMSKLLSERPDFLPEHPPGVWDDPTALNEEGGNVDNVFGG